MVRIVVPLALLVAACGDDRPPAPTAEQAERLDEAEAMLDETAKNEKGPESSLSGPSNRSD